MVLMVIRLYSFEWIHLVLLNSLLSLFSDANTEERRNFWMTVSQLGKIRHENVVLYMGACLEEPNLAIVTRYFFSLCDFNNANMTSLHVTS